MDTQALLIPLPGDNPGGSDARYETEYTRMLEEVEKLTSISHSQECRWDVVEEQATLVLQNRAKDFQAASYLGYALFRRHGLEGIADGTEILAGLVERFWDTGFPILRRVRGRVNALSWWRERMELALDGLVADTEARFDPDLLDRLTLALQRLDAGIAEHLPDQPSLRNLMDRVQRLQPKPRENPPTGTLQQAEQKTEDTAALAQGTVLLSEKPDVEQAGQESRPLAQQAATATVQAQAPKAPFVQTVAVPAPCDNAAENRKNFLRYAAEFALAEKNANPLSPLGWQATCLARLGQMEALPPQDAGKTALPPPPESEMAAVERLVQKGMAAEALSAADNLWGAHLFWLDGPRIITWALQALGSSAHEVTALETLLLVRRLEGIECMSFSDGTPFANEATLSWLASVAGTDEQSATVRNSGQGNGLNADADPLLRARSLFDEGRHTEALDALDRALSCARDKKTFLSLRLEQARLLLRLEQSQAALTIAEDLRRLAREMRAEIWASDIMLDILRLNVQCLGDMPDSSQKVRELLAEMALIRPSSIL